MLQIQQNKQKKDLFFVARAVIDGEDIVRSNAANSNGRSPVTNDEIQTRYASGFFVSRQNAGPVTALQNDLPRQVREPENTVRRTGTFQHALYSLKHLQAHQLRRMYDGFEHDRQN